MARRETDLKYILQIDSELKQIQDFDLLLERILEEARKVVNADAGTIYTKQIVEEYDAKTEKLAMKYSQNDTLQKKLPPGQKLAYSLFTVPISDKTISGYCAFTKEIVNVPDAYNLPDGVPYSFGVFYDQATGYKTTSILAVPLVTADNRLLGVIQMINAKNKKKKVIPFSADDELIIAHFAANATSALERAGMTRAMILRMIRMAELRDPKETGTHVNRVAGYAVEIYDRWAFHRGISVSEREKFRDTLKVASMLHDVGKVAISDVILKKPGRLTPEEHLLMQHHTVYGASLFEDIHSQLDNLSRDIALNHHENWDGTGYPGWVDPHTEQPIKTDSEGKTLGKKGEEIPLPGRIVGLADVYDALSSKRVYKEPWDEADVLKEIRSLAGKKFDPELVDIFFEIMPSIRQIQQLYPEVV